jgi:outer membrane cobalamin receptor
MNRAPLVALLLLPLACAGGRQNDELAPEGGIIITQQRIAASGAKTAWDAVRLTVPNVQLRETRGQAARIQRRGRASIYLDDQVRVILDHVRLDDVQVLQQIAAADILHIRVLNGMDATTYYGGASTSGVVIITTIRGS